MKPIYALVIFFLTVNSFGQCWSEVAAGLYHTLAIRSDGTLWAWGLNDNGQLGDGTTINKNFPTQIGNDTDWAFINALNNNSLALKTDGSLWAWGQNNAGQNGNGNFGDGVMDLVPTRIGADTDWIKIGQASYAIKSNGMLWGWGANGTGSLGTGDTADHYTPVQIGTDSDWVAVSIGANQRLAVKSNGTLWGWGLNKTGSLAIGPVNNFVMVPTQTGNGTADWAKIAVGGCCSSKMIKTNGTLWAMGTGLWGNLGNGTTTDTNIALQVGPANNWTSVANTNSTCALQADGTLWTWGYNGAGQLGDGNSGNTSVPAQIGMIHWQTVKTGFNFAIGISEDGTLYSWGWNNNGQLGDGTLINKNVPTQVGNSCFLSTSEYFPENNIQVSPNPATDYLNIRVRSISRQTCKVVFRDILGREIISRELVLQNGDGMIDMRSLAPATYLLTLIYEDIPQTFKIIKR